MPARGAGTLAISRWRIGKKLITPTVIATPSHCVQRSELSKT